SFVGGVFHFVAYLVGAGGGYLGGRSGAAVGVLGGVGVGRAGAQAQAQGSGGEQGFEGGSHQKGLGEKGEIVPLNGSLP
nr:hypothetical protein [Tanacetum cinerariifolium]